MLSGVKMKKLIFWYNYCVASMTLSSPLLCNSICQFNSSREEWKWKWVRIFLASLLQARVKCILGLGNYAWSFLHYAMPAIPGNEIMLPDWGVLCSHNAHVMGLNLWPKGQGKYCKLNMAACCSEDSELAIESNKPEVGQKLKIHFDLTF